MKTRFAMRGLLMVGILILAWTTPMCATNHPQDQAEERAEKKAEDEPLLSSDEQRALRAEAALEADESITTESFDEAFEALKKEIEGDL